MQKWTFPALLVLAAASSSCIAQSPAVDGLVSLFSRTDRSSAKILLEGLPQGREVRVQIAARGLWNRKSAMAPSIAGSAYPNAAHFSHRIAYNTDSWAAVAYYRARAVDGSPVSIRLVDDFGRVHCEASGSGEQSAVCVADIPHRDFPALTSRREIVLSVQAEVRGPIATPLVVEGFAQDLVAVSLQGADAQSDPIVPPSGEVIATLPINLRTVAPGRQEGRLLKVLDGDGRLLRHVGVLSQWDGTTLAASQLLLSDGKAFSPSGILSAASTHSAITTHRRLVFLVPGNATSLDVTARSVEFTEGVSYPAGTPHDVSLHLFHVARSGADAAIAPAPSDRAADLIIDAETWKPFPTTATERATLSGDQLKPGVWYAVPVSKTGIPLNLSVSLRYPTPPSRTLEPQAGHYFNPERQGHGFYLGKAGGDWVLIWYAYERDGQPVWYYAQDLRPSTDTGGSQWYASLYRNVWNGSETRFQYVGWVQIAALSETELEFAHLVDGELGIQSMRRLGPGGCSQTWSARPLDVNGLWFAPQKSGYGFSAELVGGTEFYLSYAYDAAGRPRWATAQQSFNAASSMPLLQARGFCPTCTAGPVQRAAAGTFSRDLVSAAAPDDQPGFSRLGIDARWINGIPGAWTENRPVSLLSARIGCP